MNKTRHYKLISLAYALFFAKYCVSHAKLLKKL